MNDDAMRGGIGVGREEWERKTTSRTGAGLVDDPYPKLAALRAEAPVHRGSFFALFDVPDPTAEVWPDADRFSTVSYAETEQVLRDSETFSNAGIRKMTEFVFGPVSLMGADNPEHRKFRSLVQPAFGRKGLELWSQHVRPRLDTLIDGFVARGHSDLYFEYCAQFPVYVIAMTLGVDAKDLDQFHHWAALMQIAAAPAEEARAARRSVEDYMRHIIHDRRANPRDDLVSMLVDREIVEDDGRYKITDEQILGLICNLLPAGAGTTYRSLGILLVTLLERPALIAKLYGDRSIVPTVIDELLRWNGPVLVAPPRLATRDTQIGNMKIPAGSIIEPGIAAANRDPKMFDDAETFNPMRGANTTLAFSTGPHFCAGASVARMELVTALNALLDRLPNLRLDPDAAPPTITGLWYRMPTGVPVVWG